MRLHSAVEGPTWPHSCVGQLVLQPGHLSFPARPLILQDLFRPVAFPANLPAVVFQEGESEAARSLDSEVTERCFHHILLVKASHRLDSGGKE